MTTDQLIIVGLIAAALMLFLLDRWRHDVVAFTILLAAVVAGVVPAENAFSGFGHPATVTVAAILVLSHALARTGAADILARVIARAATSMTRHIAALAGLGAVMSSVMNNVAALGLLMPAAIQSTEKTRYGAGAVLMPLSFATMLGGLLTLIGTPPNIIIAGFREDALGAPFRMFDFAPVGLALVIGGIAFLALLSRFFIPRRRLLQTTTKDHMNIDKFVTEARVVKGTDAVGMTPGEISMLATDCDVLVMSVNRRGRRFEQLPLNETLKIGDRLLIESSPDGLDRFTTLLDLKVGTMAGAKSEQLYADEMDLVEAVVRPDARMIDRELDSLRLRYRYGIDILAVSRRGRPHRGRLGRFRFRSGDVILFHGHRDHIPDMLVRMGCLPLAKRGVQFGDVVKGQGPLAIGVFAAAVILATLGVVPIAIALGLAAVAMVVLGLLPVREIYDGVDWPVILLIASLIPVGQAFENTGTTDLIAQGLLSAPIPLSPAMLMVLLMVTTIVLSSVLNNAATAVIMAPVALTIAERLSVNPDPFLMATAVAASTAFMTPVGHQNNALVMGPAGYAFGDYWRLGLPLTILVLVISVPAILTVWPL